MIRRALARLILRLAGPELRAEMQRIASAEAHYAVVKLNEQDQGILAFARQTEVIVSDIVAFLERRAGLLPGELKAVETINPKKLN